MSRGSAAEAALAGVAAGAVTLGMAEIGAALLTRTGGAGATPSPLLAVADTTVDYSPAWLRDIAIATFGTADKTVLLVGMGVVLAVVCAGIGRLAASRMTTAMLAFVVVGAVGTMAVLTRPGAQVGDVVPTAVAVVVGLFVMNGLTRPRPQRQAGVEQPATSTDRRSVLVWGASLTVLGTLGIVAGRALQGAGQVVRAAREMFTVPAVAEPVVIPAQVDPGVEGLSPWRTPNDAFYRIDTALAVPQVDPGTWRLRVHGLVEREVEIDFDHLLAQEMVEAAVTLTCVSNPVGGDLVGNAVWTGWPVRELLARAGPHPDADMVLSTSADGWSAGTPLNVLTDERNALLAVAMNGRPLPAQHGFPVRLVVPGLYGYVSATKWVTDLKVTRFADDEGYWSPRGWSERGPIKTASRIDVPAGERVQAGATVIAGVAWAQHRGISAVEVRIDNEPWQQATLAAEPSVDAWRMWHLDWEATPGEHVIVVRATDGGGATQTERAMPPVPDGASGWHSVQVEVI